MPDAKPSVSEQARRLREAILSRHGFSSHTDVPANRTRSAIEDAAGLSTVTAHWGIVSEVPVLGRFIVIAKRASRIALRWYINPIVEQQNAFNDAVVRSLYELQAENDRLRALVSTRDTDEGAE